MRIIFFVSFSKAGDTPGDFIRRSPRSAKIARCARCSNCDFRRSPWSAYKIADIWHVSYRQLNSPAFTKCTRSCDFLRSSLRIEGDFIRKRPSGAREQGLKAISPRSAKKIARCVRINRWRKSLAISARDQSRCDWRIKSPDVSLA